MVFFARWTLTVFCRCPAKYAWTEILLGHGTPEDIRGLQKYFPISAAVDLWEFSHIHKVVLGILSLNLEIEMQKSQYSKQIAFTDTNGKTPLHWAALKGDGRAVQLLLLRGASPNACDYNNNTSLHMSVRSGNLCCTEYLLSAGVDVHVRNRVGKQAIHEVRNNVAIVKALVRAGASVNAKDNTQSTLLSYASTKDACEIGEFLLLMGANINQTTIYGGSPLHSAVAYRSVNFVQMLLSKGADHTIINKSGENILHRTASLGDNRIARILTHARLEGVNTKARDSKGRTPRDALDHRLIRPEGFVEAFEILLSSVREANERRVHDVIEEDKDEFMEALEVQEVSISSIIKIVD